MLTIISRRIENVFIKRRWLFAQIQYHILHYRLSICPCRIRVENALKTHVKRISFPTRISKIQSKPTFDTRWTAVQRIYL